MTAAIWVGLGVVLVLSGAAIVLSFLALRDSERQRQADRERWAQRHEDLLEERRQRRRKMGLPELDDEELQR